MARILSADTDKLVDLKSDLIHYAAKRLKQETLF